MFERLLIANRGEIACRILKSARRLGIHCIAIHSEVDAGALHVRLADEAHCVGGPRPAESYLCIDAVLKAAQRSGAEAVHPGYGFLSENADFAEACAAAGLVFVGPGAAAIRSMGRKDAAKQLMEGAGVPVVPGYHGESQDFDVLAGEAARIGFPLLVKASAGGGGRGMRRVDHPDALEKALAGASREATSAFGDGDLLLERFVEPARHVEVQVFGDSQGNFVHLFDRDCSIQRRHQKLIEEAPAPGLGEGLREEMADAALCAARTIDYQGAGTVEFILDAGASGETGGGIEVADFYFMEMNTRLQVEHPVTEFITGQDLVEWQLRVAAGEPLPCAQEDLHVRGHAIEARLCAEDPAKRFLPSPGLLEHLRVPEAGPQLRVDGGFVEGDAVSPFYDNLLAKVVASGADRESARRRLVSALGEVEVVGPVCNATYLRDVAAHPAFASGQVHTGFLEQHEKELRREEAPSPRTLAAAVLYLLRARESGAHERAAVSADRWSPWEATDGFRLSTPARETLCLRSPKGEILAEVDVLTDSAGWRMEVSGRVSALSGEGPDDDGSLWVRLDGEGFPARASRRDEHLHLWLDGVYTHLLLPVPKIAEEGQVPAGGGVVSALPGRVVRVLVEPGARVRRGDVLLVVEAMKMEHEIRAPADGEVRSIACSPGDAVEEGVALVELEPVQS